MESPEKQEKIKEEQPKPARDEKGRILPGHSGNPAGRPKDQTMKEFAREWYKMQTPEEKIAYIKKVEEKRPGFAWSMAEGNPHQTNEMEVNTTLQIEFADTFKKIEEPEHVDTPQ